MSGSTTALIFTGRVGSSPPGPKGPVGLLPLIEPYVRISRIRLSDSLSPPGIRKELRGTHRPLTEAQTHTGVYHGKGFLPCETACRPVGSSFGETAEKT